MSRIERLRGKPIHVISRDKFLLKTIFRGRNFAAGGLRRKHITFTIEAGL